jgi:TrmH family RNA methyltransferase
MRPPPADHETISSIKDPRVVAARKGLEVRSLYLIEGAKMLRQALEHRALVESVFFLDPLEEEARALFEAALDAAPSCSRASRGVFFKILGLGYETATDVLALVRVPEQGAQLIVATARESPDACYLVGQGIRDPRNVGVLVRTADAFSAKAFILSADSAFPWSRQSIRSTTGSIFRVPVYLEDDLAAFLKRLRERGVAIVGTSASAAADFAAAPYRFPCAVVMGNETDGISEEVRAECDLLLRIPMPGGAHSLNVTVAGGILLQEIARRRPRGAS